MTEAPLVYVRVCVCMCESVCMGLALWTLQLWHIAEPVFPRQHQGAVGVFDMLMIADE